MVSDERRADVAHRVETLVLLSFEGSIALNWTEWLNAYEIYAVAVGVASKSE